MGKVRGADCAKAVYNATLTWLVHAGGRRIDSATSYDNLRTVGRAMADSGVPRKEMFITSKTGGSLPMGYNETVEQVKNSLEMMGTTYYDNVMIHWPVSHVDPNSTMAPMMPNDKRPLGWGPAPLSSDPACVPSSDNTACRISTC